MRIRFIQFTFVFQFVFLGSLQSQQPNDPALRQGVCERAIERLFDTLPTHASGSIIPLEGIDPSFSAAEKLAHMNLPYAWMVEAEAFSFHQQVVHRDEDLKTTHLASDLANKWDVLQFASYGVRNNRVFKDIFSTHTRISMDSKGRMSGQDASLIRPGTMDYAYFWLEPGEFGKAEISKLLSQAYFSLRVGGQVSVTWRLRPDYIRAEQVELFLEEQGIEALLTSVEDILDSALGSQAQYLLGVTVQESISSTENLASVSSSRKVSSLTLTIERQAQSSVGVQALTATESAPAAESNSWWSWLWG